MTNRKKAEEMILGFFKEMDKSGFGVETYKKILSEMDDKSFHRLMEDFRDGKRHLIVFAPHFKVKYTVENNIKVAKKLNIPLFEALTHHDPERGTYTLPHKTLLLDLPINRKSQNLDKKSSIPKDNKTIDQLTFTPTGESKGSTLSNPEFGQLRLMGLNNCLTEFLRPRGGDKGGLRAYNASIDRLGSVSLKAIEPYLTGVTSTKSVISYFRAAHLNLEV